MQLPGRELFVERLINALLALDPAFADEFGAYHQGLEMLAIAIKGEMFAGHAGANEFFDLFGMHN
jgi:hypothetical protein